MANSKVGNKEDKGLFQTLRFKLIMVSSIPVLIVVVVLTFLFIQSQKTQIQKQLISRGETVAGIMAYNASINANTEPNKRRTYLAVASRPDPTAISIPRPARHSFRLISVVSLSKGTIRLDFHLPSAGRIEMSIYTLSGQLLTRLEKENCAAGNQSVVWTQKGHHIRISSGIYLVKGDFYTKDHSEKEISFTSCIPVFN